MPGSQIAKAIEVNPSLLAFRPRQVALLSKPPIMKGDNTKTLVLTPEKKVLLFHSIAQFLQRSGFSKTVKKFLSEAKIQKHDLGDSLHDLEEIFCKFLDMCDVSKNSKSHKEEDATDDVPVDVKAKEKKRNKKDSDALDQEQANSKVLEQTNNGADNESKEEKKKKKKKNKKSSDPVIDDENTNVNDSKEDEIQSPKKNETDNENKSSKKRKRLSSEDVAQHAIVVEESKNKKKDKSKRRKTEGSEEPKVEMVSTELKSTTESDEKAQKEEKNQACSGESKKTIAEQVLSNGSLEKSGEKSSIKKTMKEQNGSAEPNTVKHFQRVKVDEVVFSDERLKDNSYWAKDGAEIGYGAKAQEILEQVRGRDFRHEKTKKKRGSYRGGQIDLQSHSVKFNYSDEE